MVSTYYGATLWGSPLLFCALSLSASVEQVNATYTFWTLGTNTMLLFLYCVVTASITQSKQCDYLQIGNIRRAINNNGMVYFLVSNLATGAVNISIRTLDYEPLPSFLVLCFYMLATCGCAVLMDANQPPREPSGKPTGNPVVA